MEAVGEKFGRAMLEKMGWTAGTGLGAKRNGCVEPLAVKSRPEKLGVGAERRAFQDAWWEKAFEDAYGKSVDHADDEKLLSACEGRRCRPHGAGKLARLAKQDISATLRDGSKEPASEENNRKGQNRSRACGILASAEALESAKVRKGRDKREVSAPRECSAVQADIGHEDSQGKHVEGEDVSASLATGIRDRPDKRERGRKRSKQEKHASVKDKPSRKHDAEGPSAKIYHSAPRGLKVSSGRVRKIDTKP